MINKFLFLLLLVGASSCFPSTTFRQAQKVFIQLQVVSGTHLKLKYNSGHNSNAWATVSGVTINQGMLDDCRDEKDLAMILGHEIGHCIHGDVYSGSSRVKEMSADQVGYNYCVRLGYNRCSETMLYMYRLYGDEQDREHPDWLTRYRHVRK